MCNNIDRNIIKEQAAEKKQRQVINKLVRGAEMKKEDLYGKLNHFGFRILDSNSKTEKPKNALLIYG